MGGDVEDSTEAISTRYVNLCIWRKAIARGDLIGPRMVIAGFLIDGYPWQGDVPVSNPSEARAAVDALHDMGIDFIKVKSLLPREAYLAIADEARRENIVFAGHVPDAVPASEASASGQKSIEHLTGIALGSSAEEASLSKELISAFAARDRPRYGAVQVRALETFDSGKAEKLFQLLAANGTWQVPTLVELRRNSTIPSSSTTSDPRWAYVPNRLRIAWVKAAQEDIGSDAVRPSWPAILTLVRQMHAAGVDFMAGTDSPNPSILPGFGLHEELQLLVSTGFTPMEALQAATRNPARYLQRESELGTIEEGKLADMVLLSANPLDDISNTKSIWAVVQDGRYLNRAALDSMLLGAKEAAKWSPASPTNVLIFLCLRSHSAILKRPLDKSFRGILYASDIRRLYIPEVLPSDIAQIRICEVGVAEIRAIEGCTDKTASPQIYVCHVCFCKRGVLKMGVAKVCRLQIGIGEID